MLLAPGSQTGEEEETDAPVRHFEQSVVFPSVLLCNNVAPGSDQVVTLPCCVQDTSVLPAVRAVICYFGSVD